MNYIINPINGEKINLFSIKGRSLLKTYIKNYKTGGEYYDPLISNPWINSIPTIQDYEQLYDDWVYAIIELVNTEKKLDDCINKKHHIPPHKIDELLRDDTDLFKEHTEFES